MTTQSSRRALQLRLWALFMFFFIPGLLMASWATRTPAIRDLLALSTAEMGVVLFGLSVGSMSGILCSAWLVKRFGTRKVIRTTMSFAVLGMLVLSLALWVTSAPLFAFGLAIFGASFGSAEVAINVEGAAIEREMNKTVLPMMHGFYSLGTLAGAGIGMALTALGIPFDRVDHDPAEDMADCAVISQALGADICKNLLLTPRNRSAFYLLAMPGDKPFVTKDLSKQIGSSRLSFATAEDLEQLLGVQPGSASVLGLLNDTEHRVTLVLDRAVAESRWFGCHPCRNTSSLRLRTEDVLEKFLPHTGHVPLVVEL